MTNPSTFLDQMPPPIRTYRAPESDLGQISTLQIGNVAIGFPVVQAALSGYSDGPMRMIARQLGATYTLAEVMIDRLVLQDNLRQKTRRCLLLPEEPHPVGGQLMGSEPAQFELAAQKLVEVGFDIIDINFGCPVQTAAGGCRGGYHLGQPDVALEIVSRTRNAVPPHIPVTLKMRRGLDDAPQSHDNFYRILDGAFERGVAAITVHGRTVQQRYVGPSNWDFLREVKQHAGHRIILGSGDLFTARACLEMIRDTGVDGVSVARGAIGNPWIFSQAQALAAGSTPVEPDLAEQRRVMNQQFDLCLRYYQENQAISIMRSFAVKFARLHSQHTLVRNAFAAIKTQADWNRVMDCWYAC